MAIAFGRRRLLALGAARPLGVGGCLGAPAGDDLPVVRRWAGDTERRTVRRA